MRTLTIICLAFLVPSFIFSSGAQEKPPAQSSNVERKTATQTADVQGLREDLTRMKALVQQMQMNLAFVDTTQSPLKHQFQLQIDMWNIVIKDMEARLQSASPR
jgi:hypothetical protein